MAERDDAGTPPNYTVGVGNADKAVTITGTGVHLVERIRPGGRPEDRGTILNP